MTRETKVGLIVAGSFLCLVCVVVASKLRHGDDPVNDASEAQTVPGAVAAVNPKHNAPPPDGKKEPTNSGPQERAPEKKAPAPPVVVEAPKVPALIPQPSFNYQPLDEGKGASPQIAQIEKGKDKVTAPPVEVPLPKPPEEKKSVLELSQLKPIDLPPPVPSDKPVLTIPPPTGPKEATPMVPSIVAKENPPKDAPTTFPSLSPKEVTPVNRPLTDKDPPGAAPKEVTPSVPTFPVAKDGPPTFPPNPPKENLPTFPVAKDGPGPIETPTFPPLPAPKDTVVTAPKDGVSSFPPPPKDLTMPTLPSLSQPTPIVGSGNKVPSIPSPSELNKGGFAPVPTDTHMPPNPIARIPSGDVPVTPPISTKPTLTNPGTNPMPVIRNTDIHVCQPGETSFAALSLKFYGTDKYGQALLLYNRENYKGTVNGSIFLRDTPVLEQGQQVHIAPQSILERDYLTVQPVSRGPVPKIPSEAPVLSRPTPLNPGIAAVSNPPTSGQARTYVVQNPNGESILDIAERAMGDRSQWHKIWRVNPAYPPQFRIPVGTKLEIPAN